ncbi:hypothetical protein D9M71_269520 [compost metagenome]
MVVDDVALFLGQGAASDGEVVQLAAVEFVLGHMELETPGIVRRHQVAGGAYEDVVGTIGQQLFLHR